MHLKVFPDFLRITCAEGEDSNNIVICKLKRLSNYCTIFSLHAALKLTKKDVQGFSYGFGYSVTLGDRLPLIHMV